MSSAREQKTMQTFAVQLQEILTHLRPSSLLCLGPGEFPLPQQNQEAKQCTVQRVGELRGVEELGSLGHFDLGVVCGLLEPLPREAATMILGRLRNVHCERIALWLEESSAAQWPETDFYSLGMRRGAPCQHDDTVLHCYSYNLADYNRVRSWNNPSNWANPENFGKYRW